MTHTHKKKILFVAAEPKNLEKVKWEEELVGIMNHKDFFDSNNQFDLEYRFNLSPKKLRKMCMSYKPDILHYSGHSWHDGDIRLEDEKTKESIAIDSEFLGKFFSFYKEDIDCVIFNSCWSSQQALYLKAHIKHVISMSNKVHCDFADEFASEFYAMLFSKYNIVEAFAYAHNFADWNAETRGVPSLFKDNHKMNNQDLKDAVLNTGISSSVLEKMRENAQNMRARNLSDNELLDALADKSPFPQFIKYYLGKRKDISVKAAKEILKTEDRTEYLFLSYSLARILYYIAKAMLFGEKRMLDDFRLGKIDKKENIILSLEFVMAKLGKKFDEDDKGLNLFRKYTKYLISELI